MAEQREKAVVKGVEMASKIEEVFWTPSSGRLSVQVTTERGNLTKVTVRRRVGEPDAAGQGGRAPSS
jgi:hypothetical protein